MAFPLASDVVNSTSGSSGGVNVGASTGKVGFYGATPVVQRATATTHTTTNMVTSASFGATQVAIVQEIMNTLIAVGLWAA
jgi:hypothetical protein